MRRCVVVMPALLAVFLVAFNCSPREVAFAQQKSEPLKSEDIAERMLRSTAFIVRPRPDKMVGGRLPFNRGSGSLIVNSGGRRIVLTNFHVVGRPLRGEPHQVYVMFPIRRPNGEVVSEAEKYMDALEDVRFSFLGAVLDIVPELDLALIELNRQQPLPPHIRPLPLADRSPRQGAGVHTMGNPGVSGLWSYTKGEVRSVYDKRIPFILDGERINVQARVIDTTNPINKGDSGGPLVNDKVEQVGVAQSIASEAQAVSTFIAIEEVWKVIDKNKLRGLVTRGATTTATREVPKPTETRPVAARPAPTEAEDPQKAERLAAAKLKQAKLFLNDGQVQDALEVLADVIERWPNTKAAAEAKHLQREWKKKPN